MNQKMGGRVSNAQRDQTRGCRAVAFFCLAALTVLAACGGGGSSPVTQGGSSPATEELEIERSTTWQEVFNTFSASEQECIRSELGSSQFESAMEQEVLGDTTTEEWDVSLYGCLDTDTARGLILSMVVATFELGVLQEDFGLEYEMEFGEEERSCLRDWVGGIDPAALAEEGDSPAALEASFGVIACVPDMLITVAAQELNAQGLGVAPDELSDEERTCLRDWARDIDSEVFAEDDELAFLEIGFGMFECLPDLLIAFVAEGLGVAPDKLSDEERTCLRDWARDIDSAALMADADDPAAVEAGLGMLACVPDLFSAGFAQEFENQGDEPTSTGPDDHADWAEDATVVAVDEPIGGEIEDLWDIDFFAFQGESGVTYQIDVEPVTMSDPYLTLYDDFGELDYSDDYDGLAPRIYWEAPSSGTYFVAVEGFDLGTYVLTIASQ